MDDSHSGVLPADNGGDAAKRSPGERTAHSAPTGGSEADALASSLTDQVDRLANQILADQAGDHREKPDRSSAESPFHSPRLRHEQRSLERRERAVEESEAVLRQMQRTIALAHDECASERSQLAQLRQRLSEQQNRLEAAHEEVDRERARTRRQRRRIAREFKAQRAAHLKELEQRKVDTPSAADVKHQELDQQLQRKQAAQLRNVLKTRCAEVKQLRTQVVGLISERETLKHDLEVSRTDHDRLSQELAIHGTGGRELSQLRAQLDEAHEHLARLREQLAEARDGGPQETNDELAQRFKLAVDDVNELRQRNAELEAKLNIKGGAASGNWEAQKQRMLQSLEEEEHPDARRLGERPTIEGTIQITDRIIADKDQQIVKLQKQLLQEQANKSPTTGITQEIAEVLDKDETIRQERERLTALQAEWRGCLRQAEIDISLERAKLARERAEIEEKLRAYQQSTGGGELVENGVRVEKPKPIRGRWLARLGLKEAEE